MTKLFLTLDDAVKVAEREFALDHDIARQEFEQKCYMSNDQYSIGYDAGLKDAIKAIESLDRGR